ncbi:hypothetical protein IEQ34_002371 [Dendrobium chrysotoxum]|uniref:Uncharacterized protein n=1 Tax=Dendrobium chrysotoxum TaxID=161865 RepID=A0AAV7H5R6_DENCH|nr:hypothetical protein IEQ34_002371 [Dendrobium chrysotoxum]
MLLYLSAKEKVSSPALLHHIIQARLIDRELVTVPRIDASNRDVHNNNLNCWALDGNDGHGWTPNIASTNAADLHHVFGPEIKKNEKKKNIRFNSQENKSQSNAYANGQYMNNDTLLEDVTSDGSTAFAEMRWPATIPLAASIDLLKATYSNALSQITRNELDSRLGQV